MKNHARIVVRYPRERGAVRLRGDSAPLDWATDNEPKSVAGDVSTFEVPIEVGQMIECKLVRSDGAWAAGRNLVIAGGDELELRPSFGEVRAVLGEWEEIASRLKSPLRFRVLLPPSYAEQDDARYPVLYAQDAQSLWSDSNHPFGAWDLDDVLSELWSLGAMQEFIVVSLDTTVARLDRLGPVRDVEFGGGHGDAYLSAIVDELKPKIDRTLRTMTERQSTVLLGSSMGGLFSFFAAWKRPDVFGAAICLSSSFWWADRYAIRLAQTGACPTPRPMLYLDSGAVSSSELQRDSNSHEGQHHTRAMERVLVGHCYEPGKDLHVLTFPGHHHDNASWTARVAIPLQLVFPRGY